MGELTDHQEEETIGELELALKKVKNRKSPGTNYLYVGLLKFECTSPKINGLFSSTTCGLSTNYLNTGKQKY